jgi:hypothetical protein
MNLKMIVINMLRDAAAYGAVDYCAMSLLANADCEMAQ